MKHFTEMHNGTVSAFSEGEGKGSQFTITLPLLADDVIVNRPELTTTEYEAVGDGDVSGIRVLIVDDDTDGREWVRHVLTAKGADTMDVSSVDQALTAVDAFRPHVVVSDLAMPQRNGFDLVAELRARGHQPAHLPIIALSAFASAEDKMRALGAGFQYFLSKPPEPLELLRLVRRASRKSEKL